MSHVKQLSAQRILNAADLTSHGHAEGRQLVLEILEAGMRAADPYFAMKRVLRREGDLLIFGGDPFIPPGSPRGGDEIVDLTKTGRIFVFGSAKGVQRAARCRGDRRRPAHRRPGHRQKGRRPDPGTHRGRLRRTSRARRRLRPGLPPHHRTGRGPAPRRPRHHLAGQRHRLAHDTPRRGREHGGPAAHHLPFPDRARRADRRSRRHP